MEQVESFSLCLRMTKGKVSRARARDSCDKAYIVVGRRNARHDARAPPSNDCFEILKQRLDCRQKNRAPNTALYMYARLHTREKTITHYPIADRCVIDLYYPLSIAVVLYNFSCYTLSIAPK